MTVTERARRWLAWAVLGALLAWAGAARAQPVPLPEARMVAQALFVEGRRLMSEGEHAAACVKFEESDRLDRAMGTQFHLADCYALTSRLASAWILFVDVAAQARASGQTERAEAADKRAEALEPRLNRLTIDVERPFEGLEVRRNGTLVGRGQWNTALPIDAGEHVITSSAESHHPWRRTIRIKGEGKAVRVVVPALKPLPVRPRPKTEPPQPVPAPAAPRDEGISVRSAAALAMGVLGLVAVGIGAAAGIVAIDKTSESEKYCPDADACFDRGLALREEARRAAAASTVSFAVGGSALVSGLILWLTIPDDPSPAGSAWGVTIRGSW